MRIGILTHNYPRTSNDRSDAGIFIYDLAQELAKKHQVFVLCPDIAGKKEPSGKAKVSWFDWPNSHEKLGSWKIYNPISVFKFFKLMRLGKKAAIEFIKKNKIDCLIAMWGLPGGIWANEAKKKTGLPYLSFSLGSDINIYANYPILNRYIKQVLKNSDLNLTNSLSLKEKVFDQFKINIDYLPLLTNIKTKDVKLLKLGRSVNFLYVGRLEKVKGVDLLVEAYGLLKDWDLDFSLNILGSGSLLNQLKATVNKSGLERKVNFLGQADEKKTIQYMRSSDYLVIPSRLEGMPLVFFEASQSGLPIISTNAGDCPKLINKYQIGLVAKNITADSIAETIKKAIKDKNLNSKFKDNLKKLNRDFSFEKSIKILSDHLKKISLINS